MREPRQNHRPMAQEQWTAVDEYVTGLLVPEEAALEAAERKSEAAGLPAIAISPPQGKLLYLLARAIRATDILEFGTLGAYSTIWLARALPETGRLTTLEADPDYAEVARANISEAGLESVVDVRVGAALDLLPDLHEEGPFDFTFIDADKANIPDYFDAAVRMSRPGALIAVDNVVRHGRLIDADSTDPDLIGVRRLHDMLAEDDRVTATSTQTVGVKGYDGFTLAMVKR